MTIDFNNLNINKPGQSSVGNNGVGKPDPSGSSSGTKAKPPSSDEVSLSPEAQALARLEQALNDASDVDESRVEEVRRSIDNGTYEINNDRIAQKMVDNDDLYGF